MLTIAELYPLELELQDKRQQILSAREKKKKKSNSFTKLSWTDVHVISMYLCIQEQGSIPCRKEAKVHEITSLIRRFQNCGRFPGANDASSR